jgi:hypothetical protein
MSIEHFQDAWNTGARAVLALADARKRLPAVAQVDGFMIGVELKSDRAGRPAFPR